MNRLIELSKFEETNVFCANVSKLVQNKLPEVAENYYENTYYTSYNDFQNSNRVLNHSFKFEMYETLTVNGLQIGGGNNIIYPAYHNQGISQGQAILDFQGNIVMAYYVTFDGTNFNYESVKVNNSGVTTLINESAPITNDAEMQVFLIDKTTLSIDAL